MVESSPLDVLTKDINCEIHENPLKINYKTQIKKNIQAQQLFIVNLLKNYPKYNGLKEIQRLIDSWIKNENINTK